MKLLKRNAILRDLPDEQASVVLKTAEIVEMKTRQSVYLPEDKIKAVYFPIDAFLSVVTRMKDGAMIEVGTVGREGMTGIPLLMGSESTANECFCQVPGRALVIPSQTFRQLLPNEKVRKLLDRYLQAYVNMLGQLAACNRLHSVLERAARWLLMTHDRVNRDSFALTHEFLATMLGSRRSGVTIAAAALQRAGYIHYEHGCMTILDRKGLEQASCECYEVTRRQFGSFLRPSVKQAA
ncbi:MAG: Crp/Fnr family transcriptional regulator [Candidatus Eremiobacteraeota bacterium]|nr:Crp/Fnr family transcriptional regulator [Candidatus Eremiobacteraeota bacterium]